MIEWIVKYPDLLALTLGFAVSGLIIFMLYLVGFIGHSADSDLETEFDADADIEMDLTTDVDTDLDTDLSSVENLELDTDTDMTIDNETTFEMEGDTDVNLDSNDIAGTEQISISESIETKGSGSLMVQFAGFCLIFGLSGFSVLLSLGPPDPFDKSLINELDLGFSFVLFLGLIAFLLTKKALQWLTVTNINPVVGIQTGMTVTVLSDSIHQTKEGRVVVDSPDGGIKAMAIGYKFEDFFLHGERGYVRETDIPLKISKSLSNKYQDKAKVIE